jgi:hypothetical protein
MCPHCRSEYLKIKMRIGLERILILFTGKRKYFCCDCGNVFRAVDRRRGPRMDMNDSPDLAHAEPVGLSVRK